MVHHLVVHAKDLRYYFERKGKLSKGLSRGISKIKFYFKRIMLAALWEHRVGKEQERRTDYEALKLVQVSKY